MKEKIGIIGPGIVGRTLAAGFVRHGHEVLLGTRNPGNLGEWSSGEGKGVGIGNFSDAAAFGETVVLTVPGRAAEDVLRALGPQNLGGKTILDATNPIDEAPPENGVLKFFTSLDESLMERLQRGLPQAHFVKAFNSVGAAFMVDPAFGTEPTMFICGNDEGAKSKVKGFLEAFGWDVADMGGAQAARAIEPLCMLWCIPGLRENKWSHAFKLLKR